jgi:hypothetical protein
MLLDSDRVLGVAFRRRRFSPSPEAASQGFTLGLLVEGQFHLAFLLPVVCESHALLTPSHRSGLHRTALRRGEP